MTTFSKQMAKIRTQRGLTQAKLAQTMGVQTKMVSRWELAQTSPSVHNAEKIANNLGVTVDVLLGYKTVDEKKAVNDIGLQKLADKCQGLPLKIRRAVKTVMEQCIANNKG